MRILTALAIALATAATTFTTLAITSDGAHAQRHGAKSSRSARVQGFRQRQDLRRRIERRDDRLPAHLVDSRYRSYGNLPLWAAEAFSRSRNRSNDN